MCDVKTHGHRHSATTLLLPIAPFSAGGRAQGLAQGAVRVSFQHGAGVGGLDGGRDVGDVVGQEGLWQRYVYR